MFVLCYSYSYVFDILLLMSNFCFLQDSQQLKKMHTLPNLEKACQEYLEGIWFKKSVFLKKFSTKNDKSSQLDSSHMNL